MPKTSSNSTPHQGRQGFACKQFYVAHDQCAMKVSTDSLLLGSFTQPDSAKRVLDVGTGSGLLALMMAQKSVAECHVDALDIDNNAVTQARGNVTASPWPDKVSVQLTPFETMSAAVPYDVIISNPPYFHQADNTTRAYDGMSVSREQARHDSGMSMQVLFAQSAALTTENGRFNCMYPHSRYDEVLAIAAQSAWHVKRQLTVSHNALKSPYLCLFEFSKQHAVADTQHLIIRTADNVYSDAFKRLCQAFYVNF